MTYTDQLTSIQNSNGGGLSVSVSGKYTSVRHELARESGKLTAGESAKKISKELKIKVSAKEVVAAYETIHGCEPEWHHAGFYRNNRGRSTMGRTFFFSQEEVEELTARWNELAAIEDKKEAERIEKQNAAEKREAAKKEYLEKVDAIYRSRISERPKFFFTTKREMNGKYGWFDSSMKSYNLPEYYSGYEFKTQKQLNKFEDMSF
jgi:hypothetical protein